METLVNPAVCVELVHHVLGSNGTCEEGIRVASSLILLLVSHVVDQLTTAARALMSLEDLLLHYVHNCSVEVSFAFGPTSHHVLHRLL